MKCYRCEEDVSESPTVNGVCIRCIYQSYCNEKTHRIRLEKSLTMLSVNATKKINQLQLELDEERKNT